MNGKLNAKAGLAAKWFEEDIQDILCDSPTCNIEGMHCVSNNIASMKWPCWFIDTKSAFLQNKNIDRGGTTIYGLNDTSRS